MPKRLRWLLLAWAIPLQATEPGQWTGMTRDGLRFAGSISRISGQRLYIETTGSGNPLQVGIPLDKIDWIRLEGDRGEGLQFLVRLESNLPLLGCLAEETMADLEGVLEGLASEGRWDQLLRWTARLLQLDPGRPISERIRILHAWSLLEMGLPGESRRKVAELAESVDALEMDPRLCWLAGWLALREGDSEAAEFWIRLPSLQIPAVGGRMEEELEHLNPRRSGKESR